MSRDLVEDLKKLESYGIAASESYVLATPELLHSKVANDYLRNELLDLGFHQKQLLKVCRLIRNIITTMQTQHLSVKKLPCAATHKKLLNAGFTLSVGSFQDASNDAPPTFVGINTKLGKIIVHYDLPTLLNVVAISDWGLPE